jgi:hypothetical protein
VKSRFSKFAFQMQPAALHQGVDIFGCVQCDKVVTRGDDVLICEWCDRLSCPEHAETAGIKICQHTYCDAYICLVGACVDFQNDGGHNALYDLVDEDDNPICVKCDECGVQACGWCSTRVQTDTESHWSGSEHADHINRPGMVFCTGSEAFPGCLKDLCNLPRNDERCAQSCGADQIFCRACESSWCSECSPDFVRCNNYERAENGYYGCGRKFCPECAFSGETPQCVPCTLCRDTFCDGSEPCLEAASGKRGAENKEILTDCTPDMMVETTRPDRESGAFEYDVDPSVKAVKTSTLFACAPCMGSIKYADDSCADSFLQMFAETPSVHGGSCDSMAFFLFFVQQR